MQIANLKSAICNLCFAGREPFMPWIIGIDEAGYGPNLGPLVMTSVACRVPEQLTETNHWKVIRAVVRRQDDPQDDRFVVDDSKLVYSPAIGLCGLETGVWSILVGTQLEPLGTLKEYVDWACSSSSDDLLHEPWFTGTTCVPFAQERAAYQDVIASFTKACQDCDIQFGPIHSVVICPPRFNQLLNHWDSKGA